MPADFAPMLVHMTGQEPEVTQATWSLPSLPSRAAGKAKQRRTLARMARPRRKAPLAATAAGDEAVCIDQQ